MVRERSGSVTALAAASIGLALVAPARADTAPALTGPAVAIGDGATPILLRLSGAPAGADHVTVDATGGLVGTIAEDGEVVQIVYIPPRIAAAIEVTVTATAGRHRASRTIALTVPALTTTLVRGTGTLELTVPDRLVLGATATGEISVVPPAGADVRIVASTGVLGAPSRDEAGVLHVAYSPPAQRAPTRAVIGAVTSDGKFADVATIALYGIGRVDAKSRPGAGVTVRVGEEVFGPFRADRHGRTAMAVLAGPGIAFATATADRRESPAGGGRRVDESTLPLAAVPASRIAAACLDGAVVTFAVDDAGAPLAEPPEVRATTGTAGAPTQVGPGASAIAIAPASDAVAGAEVTITAALAGDPASVARCDGRVPGEDPDRWDVTVDGRVVVAGTAARITAVPHYPGRLPHRRIPVTLTVDRGAVADLVVGVDGTVTAAWNVDRLDGATTATATVRAGPAVAGTVRVPVRPGPIAAIIVDARAVRVRADGRSSAAMPIRAEDRAGNPVSVQLLRFTARGRVSTGSGTARYVAPVAYDGAPDHVVATDPVTGTSASVTIDLVASRRPLAAGARAGYFTNLGGLAGPAFAIDGGFRLPVLGRRVVLGAELGWYGDSRALGSNDEPVALSISVVPVLARATYGLEFGRASLYAGGAVGTVVTRVETSSVSTGMSVERSTPFAFAAIAGIELAVGPGRAVIEAAYGRAGVIAEVARGDVGGLHLTAGFRVER